MVKTRQWQLAHKPRDSPQLSGPDQTFKLVEVDLPELKDGEVLLKVVSISNDPAQRGWIDPDIAAERLYVPPVQIGQIMSARSLAEVVESKSSKLQKGDTVTASTGWTEYAVVNADACQPAKDLPNNLSKTNYLGALGLTGLTAYFGLTEVGEIKQSDVVVVSGAAGATGMMAVQIAKKIFGCKKVIGIAGTDDKCRWVEKLGADVCLNYKSKSFAEDMKKETPDFANVYFDNVAGEILDLMFTRMASNGRIVACGAISAYNTSSERTTGLKNWFEIIIMRVRCQGFIVLDYASKFGHAIQTFTKAMQEGKLIVDESSETVVDTPFEDVPKTWMKLFDGGNQGKLITRVV